MKQDKRKTEYLMKIRNRIRKVIEDNELSQADVLAQATAHGYNLRQSTLSKIMNDCSSMSITNIIHIANTLNLDLNDLFSESDNMEVRLREPIRSDQKQTRLISDPESHEMYPYLGEYHAYFFSTISSEDNILSGKLSFFKSPDEKKTLASFTFETGKRDSNNQPIKKEYSGELILSPTMSAAYCTLVSEDIGEISYLIFNYKPINYEKLKCKIALVLTSSAGSNRIPTAHRMILSRTNIPPESLEQICGQLYLNDSEILISEAGLDRFLADAELDPSFVEYFSRPEQNIRIQGLSPVPYYYFDESIIRSAFLDPHVKLDAINLIRKYSASPRYNKVGNKCDDFVYHFVEELAEE